MALLHPSTIFNVVGNVFEECLSLLLSCDQRLGQLGVGIDVGLSSVAVSPKLFGGSHKLCVSFVAVALLSDQQTYSNHLYLMLPVAALLTVAESGAAVSLDARRAGGRDWVPGWPVWLLCAQISIVYAFAALAKLNPDFLSGSVVASYLRRDGLLAVPAAWRSLEPMLVMSLFAICSEAFLAFALWIPRWRPAALVVGLGLHLFIAGWLVPTGPLFVSRC